MQDISAFGTSITCLALSSFPMGFSISQFADDADPLSIEEIEPTGSEMLYDGSIFFFDKAAAVKLSISVIAGSDDDINMKILLQARKGTPSIIPLPDITSMAISYPDGGRIMLTNGSIYKGPIGDSLLASGRKKGNTYSFQFGSFAGAQSVKELIATVAQSVLSIL